MTCKTCEGEGRVHALLGGGGHISTSRAARMNLADKLNAIGTAGTEDCPDCDSGPEGKVVRKTTPIVDLKAADKLAEREESSLTD